ncbi:hypothetical protein C8R45DRAFT_833209, partial [Mycena sanguinolenta]
QQPTCTNLRIRSVEDAHKVFYAVHKGALTMINRRLNFDECAAIQTGCVYVWEERSPHAERTDTSDQRIRRWTDSRHWGASREREVLFHGYQNESLNPSVEREPLLKQTYSAFVKTGGHKKWHLIAYFTQSTVDQLDTVQGRPDIRYLEVPLGMFINARKRLITSPVDLSTFATFF